jgi:hypothetical protein
MISSGIKVDDLVRSQFSHEGTKARRRHIKKISFFLCDLHDFRVKKIFYDSIKIKYAQGPGRYTRRPPLTAVKLEFEV